MIPDHEQANPRDIDVDVLEEIRRLTAANRVSADPETEIELVSLRHAAFERLPPTDPARLRQPPRSSGDGVTTLAELHVDDLDGESLRAMISTQGCALVRGLVAPDRAAALVTGIDRAFQAFDDRRKPGQRAPRWFRAFEAPTEEYRVGGRKWMRDSGGIWAVDSPRMLFELCELLEESGVARLVAEHLGERPALSANKCNLRRVPVTHSGSWHQDGAFLGADVRSLNLWLALSPCGVDAPGLDIVPRRFDEVVPTGTDGAIFDWSVAPDVVDDVAGSAPVLRPRFEPGDALLFDHLFLHRTAIEPTMTKDRYAIEAWSFAPSAYPEGQIPLVY